VQTDVRADIDEISTSGQEAFECAEDVFLVSSVEQNKRLQEIPWVEIHFQARTKAEPLKPAAVQLDEGTLEPEPSSSERDVAKRKGTRSESEASQVQNRSQAGS
jgi:hypothetical protein